MSKLKAAPDTIISGSRAADGRLEVYVRTGETETLLPHIVHHSPTGFEAGYGGSGPADLALSILAFVIGDERQTVDIYEGKTCGALAWQLHHQFKRDFVAGFEHERWAIRVGQIRQWIADQERIES